MIRNTMLRNSVFKKSVFILAAALALSTGLTGCRSGSSDQGQNPSAGSQNTSEAIAAEDGLLRTAIRYDISTMDVTQTTDDYMIPMNIFDRLFETRTVDGTAQVVKSLCTDYKISEDGLTYDFTIRDGVVFSNGSALTASDVKYSFERLLVAAAQNTDIPLEIAGGEALMSGKADTLEGFAVTDDTHFTITLEAPNAGFLAELSAPAMSIVDAETMAKVKNFGVEPEDTIGTGPYVITEWEANDHYTLVYNDKYWGEKPSVQKLIARVIPDPSTQNLMFQNGELDLIDLDNLDSAIVESSYKSKFQDRIITQPKVGLTYLLLNNGNKFLKDINVRRAIGMAINVDEIISDLYKGNAIRENGIIPTGIWGHNDNLTGFTYDTAAAKKLLEDAGYKDGQISFELAMDSSSSSDTQLMYQNIGQQLEAIGIKANVKTYDHSAWLSKRSSGSMDSFVARWGMDYNDPSNIMYAFFGNEENAKNRSLNYGDKEVMARVSAARAIVDDNARMAEYQALEKKIIGEDAAWIPLFEQLHLYCMGERVQSFLPQWAGFTDFYAADVVLK